MVPRCALGAAAANIGRRSQNSGRCHGLGGLPHASAGQRTVHQNDDAGSDDGQQDGDHQQQVGGRAEILR